MCMRRRFSMKAIRITAGVALAIASTAALAVSGDRWNGSNRGFAEVPEPVVVTRIVPESQFVYTYPERDVVVERRFVTPEPVIVERVYEVQPRDYIVYRRYDPVAALNPHTGPTIGNGLFPRPGEGPNDFGG